MEVIIRVTVRAAIFLIMGVQAYSDMKTMKVYCRLNEAGMATAWCGAAVVLAPEDYVYPVAAAAMIIIQQKLKVYASGDTKLFIMALGVISLNSCGVLILYKFLMFEFVSMIIFLLYVSVWKIFEVSGRKKSEKKYRKKYPFAPAIFIAFMVCQSELF